MALVALLLAQPAGLFDDPTPWESLGTHDGLALSQREVKGSPYREYRVEARTALSVEALCEAVFEWGTKGKSPTVTRRKLLEDSADQRVVYDQIAHPLISERDYAMTVRRTRADDGSCRIRFWATNEKAPPQAPGSVRMAKLWGGWTFVADGAQTRLVHTLFSDPAGSVPPLFVHGAQRSATQESVEYALREATAAAAKAKAP